jgi:hypothetical protein
MARGVDAATTIWRSPYGAAATAHDLMVTPAALRLAGCDLDLNVVAALLTVVGYSVNDTIVSLTASASGCEIRRITAVAK